MVSPGVDLIDQDHYASQGPPHATLRRLRADAPVSWHEMPDDTGFWAITKYKDIFAISLDQKTFSSARAGVILRNWKEGEYEPQKGMLVNLDPPEHTHYRRLVSLGFSGRMIRRLEERARAITTDIIDQVAHAGECDFVASISVELPLRVIVELVGRADGGPAPGAPVEQPDAGLRRSGVSARPRHTEDRRGRALHVRERAGRRSHAASARRSRERADARRGRGPPALARGVQLVLHAAARRRQRDDAQPDLRRHAGAHRAPRGARAPAGGPVAAADRGRGDAALGDAGEPLPPHRDARRRDPRPEDPRGRQGRPVLRLGQPRRGDLPGRRPLRRRPARRTTTSPSASARTSAWAPTWRASRSA